MLTTYRRALAIPGAWHFSATGLVARLPMSIIGLGIVVFIGTLTGSYATAGVLSAAFQVSAALGALYTSRTMDRLGQHRLLPWIAAVHAVGLVVFVATVEAGLPIVVQAVVIAVSGACQPAIGSMVRARWAFVAPDADRLRGAFALESILDEFVFTVGPLVTAYLAFTVALPAPLLLAAVLALVGSIVLSLQRKTEPPARQHGDGHRGSALRVPGMLLMVVGALGVGGVFGSYEVSVVAFTQEAGRAGAAGIVLALWAAGSMSGGLVFGALHWRLPLPRQVLVLTGALALVLVPAPFVRSIPLLAVTAFVAGLAVAPALIAIFSLTERLVPSALLTEGLTWTNSGLALGFSAGTAIAGVVVDSAGTTWAFALPFLSAATAFVTAVLGRRRLGRAFAARAGDARPAAAVAWVDDPVPGPTFGDQS